MPITSVSGGAYTSAGALTQKMDNNPRLEDLGWRLHHGTVHYTVASICGPVFTCGYRAATLPVCKRVTVVALRLWELSGPRLLPISLWWGRSPIRPHLIWIQFLESLFSVGGIHVWYFAFLRCYIFCINDYFFILDWGLSFIVMTLVNIGYTIIVVFVLSFSCALFGSSCLRRVHFWWTNIIYAVVFRIDKYSYV